MNDPEVNFWDIDPQKAHPAARDAFSKEFFWDCTDDYGPFGNDDGHEVFGRFREWRVSHPGIHPLEFLRHIQNAWGIRYQNLTTTVPEEVKELLNQDTFSLHAHDQAMIALVFAQVYVEGEITSPLKELALAAINRQMIPVVAKSKWAYPDERIEHLAIMKSALELF